MEPNPWQRYLIDRLKHNPGQQHELKRIMGLDVSDSCPAVLSAHPAGRYRGKRTCGYPAGASGYCYRHQHYAGTPSTD